MSVERRPHLLYVAWGYPPSRGAGMYRALATANAFYDEGWDVTVLTPIRAVFEKLTDSDPVNEGFIREGITVRRVDFNLERGETDLRRWSRMRIASPLWWSFQRALWESATFPEPRYGSWRWAANRAARDVHRQKPVDVVIGTANPYVDFMPGWHLFKRYRIPYVMDYRDAWHLDMYSGKRVGSPRSRSARWERRLLKRALEVWFVNANIVEWHRHQYRSLETKAHLVPNGFDSAFVEAPAARTKPTAGGISVGYLGTIYGPMPLEEALEGWRWARARSDVLARSRFDIHGRLGHYSIPNEEVRQLLQRYADDGVVYHGKVAKSKVSEVYATVDALALILGRGKYVTSGKVYEYIATGLPVVSLHHPETGSSTVLSTYPRWVAAEDDTVEAFGRAFLALVDALESSGFDDAAAARAAAAQWERTTILRPRISALRDTVERSR